VPLEQRRGPISHFGRCSAGSLAVADLVKVLKDSESKLMKRHNLPFIIFGIFLAGSAGYTSAVVINALAPLIGLNGPTWAAIVGCLIFAASVLFLYYLKSN
jgi:hypothetical protein